MQKLRGVLLIGDMFCISSFLILVLMASINVDFIPVIVPIFFTLLGFGFLFSKKLHDYLHLEKAFYWISQNVMVPRTSINHLLSGFLMILIGILPLLFESDRRKIADYKMFLETLIQDSLFWVSILLIMVINLLIGLYMHRKFRGPKGS